MLKLSGFSESSYKLMIPSLYVISKFTLEKNDDNPALLVKSPFKNIFEKMNLF